MRHTASKEMFLAQDGESRNRPDFAFPFRDPQSGWFSGVRATVSASDLPPDFVFHSAKSARRRPLRAGCSKRRMGADRVL